LKIQRLGYAATEIAALQPASGVLSPIETGFLHMARSNKTTAELILQDSYTPEELAVLADVTVDAVRTACYSGQCKANIVNHDIISIERSDAIAWMETL
jgi:hypothetical protein